MSNLQLPLCSVLLSLILLILYYSKDNINNTETKIFGNILMTQFIGSLAEFIIYLLAYVFYNELIIIFLNNIVCISYCIWSFLFCIYIYYISLDNTKGYINSIKKAMIANVIVFILIIISPIVLINEDGMMYSSGLKPTITYIYCLIWFVLAIIVWFCNIKNFKNIKYAPLYFFYGVAVLIFIIRVVDPSILIISLALTLINLVMYHTIENPDIKMLREFHKQRELANESNQEKTSFLFNMSNQIKEPILAISNISGEALLEDNMEEVKEDLRRIKSSSNELLQLVNDVLDISDIEKRKIGIREVKYNVYHLFEVLNKNFSKNVSKKIEYRFHFDKSIPEYLYGDSIRIKQVMNILLENALEYTNEGFIEVNVNYVIKHDVCRLIITVEDSGLGMSVDEIKHLFDKEKIYSDELLKEVDDTKNNLGVLKSIINLMNGNILVNSEIGKGSKFTIIIDQKIKEEKTKIIETVEQYEEMYENKEKILLVINHKELSKKINKMFKKDTYEIEEVTGGQACLEKIRKNEKFDLIIMEEDLEKLSSEDTLIKLKDTSGYKIPVILISNNKGFGAKEMYQEKGFKDVLFLPLKKEEVLKQVEEYIKD